jgi:NADH dehydrogenase
VLAAGIIPSPVAAAMGVEHDKRGRIVTEGSMRSVSHENVWAFGDCAATPDPEGKPYPALAQHAIREARVVARNVHDVMHYRKPKPFVYRSLGTMAAFGHTRAAADVRGLFVTGFLAWWMRRTYYLFQMPRWDTRLRIALDWTISLFFRPDLTKVDLDEEYVQERRNCPAGATPGVSAGAESVSSLRPTVGGRA